ncbi:hypothetical protein IWZ00DRAFT_541755 [Phyllosticta capitalensis]|uniref:uncharacterized protein n=1 Tax=Phyllosticta capitalensis TaxID=121624 RepID=UPI00312F3D32
MSGGSEFVEKTGNDGTRHVVERVMEEGVALFVGEVKKRVWVKLSSFIIIFLFFTDSPHFGLVDIWITVILNRVVDRQRTNGGHWDAPAQIPVR